MRHLIPATICAMLFTVVCTTALADVYRWKDAQGKWQYSDQPEPGAERVGGKARPLVPRPPAPPAAAQRATTEPATVVPPVGKVSPQVREDVAAQRAEQCKKATENYEKSMQAFRIYKTDEKGERVFLTAAEIDAARLAASSDRDFACAK
jgi:hypothetical protein